MIWFLILFPAALLAAALWWQRRPILFWLLETSAWVGLLKHVVRKVRFSTGYTRMTGTAYHKGRRLLRPGDIILTTDGRRLSAILTPGRWAHAAICIGWEGALAEMIGDGMQIVDFSEVCFHADRVAIVRCDDWDEGYISRQVVRACWRAIDTPYDSSFEPGSKALYCFELVEAVDPERRLVLIYESLWGRRLVTGDSIVGAPNATMVWSFNEKGG